MRWFTRVEFKRNRVVEYFSGTHIYKGLYGDVKLYTVVGNGVKLMNMNGYNTYAVQINDDIKDNDKRSYPNGLCFQLLAHCMSLKILRVDKATGLCAVEKLWAEKMHKSNVYRNYLSRAFYAMKQWDINYVRKLQYVKEGEELFLVSWICTFSGSTLDLR